MFVKEPGVKITKDSANYFVIRGVKWREFETKKIEIIFIDDTIGNFVMVIKDTLNLMKSYETILNMMDMQFGYSYEVATEKDEYFVHQIFNIYLKGSLLISLFHSPIKTYHSSSCN